MRIFAAQSKNKDYDMKKNLIAWCLVALPLVSVHSQGYGGPQPLNTENAKTEREAGKVSCTLSLEYPTNATPALERAYRTVILGNLMASCSTEAFSDEEKTSKEYVFEGALSSSAQVLSGNYLKAARAEVDKMKQEMELTEDEVIGYSYEATVKKVYANPYYVTFSINSYNYTGGAHGMPFTGYYTLDRKTGHLYTTGDLFPSNVQSKLRQIVNRNLSKTEVCQTGGLFDKAEFGGNYPLPEKGVALTEKGVMFQYQAYEIAPYAAGEPSVVVPYAEVYAIMSEKGKKLSNYRPQDFLKRSR